MNPILIPKDPEKRAALARMAGLTEDEALAIDQWCASEQRAYEQQLRRGLERLANEPMAALPSQDRRTEAEKRGK